MEESIFKTIATLLGDSPTEGDFSLDIMVAINTALAIATQLGVGPKEGFFITGPSEKWADLIGDRKDFEFVKTFVYLKARLIFDPPSSSSILKAFEDQVKELESRIQMASDEYSVI